LSYSLNKIICLTAFHFAVFAGSLFGQSETNFWPEVQFYHRLNEQIRIRIVAGITRSRAFEGQEDGFIEGDLDIGLKSILRRKQEPDQHKGKYLSMRLGYSYHETFSDENPPPEHRAILEFTGRLPLPSHFLLSDRNRMDFRSIGEDRSNRYRNRIKLERNCKIGDFVFNPYGQAEFYYDSKVHGWNRNEYSFGSEFPIRRHFVLEFYYTRQNNKGSGATDVNGLGTVFQLYW
jgi:hypothetical protein